METPRKDPSTQHDEGQNPDGLMRQMDEHVARRDVTHVEAEGRVHQPSEGKRVQQRLRPVRKERDGHNHAGEEHHGGGHDADDAVAGDGPEQSDAHCCGYSGADEESAKHGQREGPGCGPGWGSLQAQEEPCGYEERD